jgi:glycerol-3-phosphate dehydrogenase subunit B
MAIDTEVLVIGGGLAGTTAALEAADRGVAVRLLSAAESTLTQASGLVDVLGYPYADGRLSEEPLADPYAGLETVPSGHPYRVVGEEAIRAGLDRFDDAIGGAYCGGHTDRNALVATPVGAMKPTARYPASVRPGLLSRPGDTLLVGFDEHPGVDAAVVAGCLESVGVPFSADAATVSFPGDYPADASTLRYARALDRDDPVGVEGGPTTETTARAALAARIEAHLEDHDRVGLPAVLGRESHGAVREDLSGYLGVPVFELPSTPPSIHGLRLADRLDDALEAAGVRATTGNPVVDATADGDRIDRVSVDREGQRIPYAADAVVLATGGLVGKGIDSDRDGVREPLFDCHVPHPADRDDWYRDDPFDDHPFARFGVPIDAAARPLDPGGNPEFENLRAAGGVVGGADVAREKSASGVSLATGVVAGREAAREVPR